MILIFILILLIYNFNVYKFYNILFYMHEFNYIITKKKGGLTCRKVPIKLLVSNNNFVILLFYWFWPLVNLSLKKKKKKEKRKRKTSSSLVSITPPLISHLNLQSPSPKISQPPSEITGTIKTWQRGASVRSHHAIFSGDRGVHFVPSLLSVIFLCILPPMNLNCFLVLIGDLVGNPWSLRVPSCYTRICIPYTCWNSYFTCLYLVLLDPFPILFLLLLQHIL